MSFSGGDGQWSGYDIDKILKRGIIRTVAYKYLIKINSGLKISQNANQLAYLLSKKANLTVKKNI